MKNKKNNNNGLKGFEEIFEVYLNTDEELARARREQDPNRNYDMYELQQFLEQENIRLGLIEKFLTKKIPAKINFSQTQKLIAHQVDRRKNLLEKTIPAINKLSSALQQNMSQLFNAHFGQ
jgi:hypothetical protein